MGQDKTALLVLDVQNGIISNLGDKAANYVKRVQTAVDAAHAAQLPVFFIVVRFRKGYPEVSPNNKAFAAIRERNQQSPMDETSPSTQPVITPGENDLVIAKKRVSAFAGSDLEMILRAQGINHLVLCGVATGRVVLHTLCQATDNDYNVTVLADGCADRDDEIHQFLLEKVFPREAEVVTIEQWAQSLTAHS